MIRHLVLWRLQAEDPVQKVRDAREIRSLLEPLVSIEGVRAIRVDENVAPIEINHDLVLTVDLDDLASLSRYADHPDHLAVIPSIRALTSDRVAIDVQL
ncbi:Dabb family protein [Humidisolicoccus flavus]|uniref:Dabb family protein n=1 Tax=Humidisolicoccus flavus TaxID=3111414 RepID=UPI003247B81E